MCHVPTCRNLVRDDKPCPSHARASWSTRPSPSARASRDPEYRRNRIRVLQEEHECRHCHAPAHPTDEVDHLLAVALGGGNERTNLGRACRRCNQKRGRETANALREKRAC